MKSLRLFFVLLMSLACYATPLQQRQPPQGELPWKAAITPPGEPGEPLVVSGTVLDSDGARPVAGAVVYVYLTDAKG
jgi:protocatechuate 3,4-dioxygenase beta subunit